MKDTPIGTLASGDFIRGAVTAALAGVLLAVGTVISGLFGTGFDAWAVDWGMVFHNTVNAALIGAEGGFAGYIGKNLMTNQNGDIPVLGKWGKKNVEDSS